MHPYHLLFVQDHHHELHENSYAYQFIQSLDHRSLAQQPHLPIYMHALMQISHHQSLWVVPWPLQ